MFHTNHTFKYLFHKEVEQIPKDETINTVSSITEQDVIQREKISFEEGYNGDVEKENCR